MFENICIFEESVFQLRALYFRENFYLFSLTFCNCVKFLNIHSVILYCKLKNQNRKKCSTIFAANCKLWFFKLYSKIYFKLIKCLCFRFKCIGLFLLQSQKPQFSVDFHKYNLIKYVLKNRQKAYKWKMVRLNYFFF